MEQYYILILVFVNGFGMAWHYLRLTRMSERKINADYSICQLPATLHWTQFVIPALFISIGFYGGGENDKCMIKEAGMGVAFCTENTLLKKVADKVIDKPSFSELLDCRNFYVKPGTLKIAV